MLTVQTAAIRDGHRLTSHPAHLTRMSTSPTFEASPDLEPAPIAATPSRLLSLDVFRGMTIAGMILVNNPGNGAKSFAPLRHADWDGFTPTDLVFPSFLFIAGVAIPLALGKRKERGDSHGAILAKVFRRAVLIVGLGLLMNAYPFDRSISTLRIPGVLQRIGLCYFAAAFLYLKTTTRTQVLTVLALLFGYWAAMTYIPAGGYKGDLSRPHNLAAWVDVHLLPGHTYKPDYDPEGLLSTLPAVATALIGVLAGTWIANRERGQTATLSGVFAAGVVLFYAGWSWGGVFPVNKALWTSSFVLLTAGLSLQILGLCSWLIETLGVKRWSWPFVVLGSNPIAAYVFSGIFMREFSRYKVAGPSGPVGLRALVYQQGFEPWFNPPVASLMFSLSYVLFWVLIMAVFYRFKIFIRL